ncbi:MAG TPA: prepilin-type N-terminal cleavage/methylation domain-containing protein [Planctomycetota bacterium]|nr:prepilin-type N-terminal cleavage/methylation domain-containing protein [Planctomycetota bacterium]
MRREKGFTLIELMIVVAIIAIIAAIAIPQLLRSRISSNETAAIGTLTTLRTVQAQFQQGVVVDQNGNGIGEYGLFQELSGQEVPRGAAGARTPGEFISQELGAVDAMGISTKAGYFYLIFLPADGVGPAVSEGDIGVPLPGVAVPADADEQEIRWCCYAWPVSRTDTGNRAFVVNQTGTVYQTQNDAAGQLYSGQLTMPVVEAAFIAVPGNPPITNLGGRFPRLGAGEVGADGGNWVPVN